MASQSMRKQRIPNEIFLQIIGLALESCADDFERQSLQLLTLTLVCKSLKAYLARYSSDKVAFGSLAHADRFLSGGTSLPEQLEKPGALFIRSLPVVRRGIFVESLRPFYQLFHAINCRTLRKLHLDLIRAAPADCASSMLHLELPDNLLGSLMDFRVTWRPSEKHTSIAIWPICACDLVRVAPHLVRLNLEDIRIDHRAPFDRPPYLQEVRAAEISYLAACRLFRTSEEFSTLEHVSLKTINFYFEVLDGWPYAPWAIRHLSLEPLELPTQGLLYFLQHQRLIHCFSNLETLIVSQSLEAHLLLKQTFFFGMCDRLRQMRLRLAVPFQGQVRDLAEVITMAPNLREAEVEIAAAGYTGLEAAVTTILALRGGGESVFRWKRIEGTEESV